VGVPSEARQGQSPERNPYPFGGNAGNVLARCRPPKTTVKKKAESVAVAPDGAVGQG